MIFNILMIFGIKEIYNFDPLTHMFGYCYKNTPVT